jgi:hypothetical protein
MISCLFLINGAFSPMLNLIAIGLKELRGGCALDVVFELREREKGL